MSCYRQVVLWERFLHWVLQQAANVVPSNYTGRFRVATVCQSVSDACVLDSQFIWTSRFCHCQRQLTQAPTGFPTSCGSFWETFKHPKRWLEYFRVVASKEFKHVMLQKDARNPNQFHKIFQWFSSKCLAAAYTVNFSMESLRPGWRFTSSPVSKRRIWLLEPSRDLLVFFCGHPDSCRVV